MRSTQSEPPSSPGTTNTKNVYSQPPPSTVTVNVPQPSMPVAVQPAHTSVQHPVSLNMSMPPNGVVVTYNNPPPPFVPPPTTQSQQGMFFLCIVVPFCKAVTIKRKVLVLLFGTLLFYSRLLHSIPSVLKDFTDRLCQLSNNTHLSDLIQV